MVVKERNIVVAILLSLVTCGIYALVWVYQVTEELKAVSGDESLSGIMAVILPIVTCNIYGWFMGYKWGKALPAAQSKYGLPAEDKSTLFLILNIVGLEIVTMALLQNEMNNIARVANPQQA